MNEIFDTSAISADKHITKDELIKEMLVKLDIILKREFPGNPQRQKVKVHKDRLSFAAPCCGDSATDNSKKRGNIILEGRFRNMYKCHNCGVCMSVNNFFKKYGQNLSFDAISYLVDNSGSALYSDSSRAFGETIYDTEEIERLAVNREWFKQAFNLQECNAGGAAYSYLVSRKQYSFNKFLYNPTHQLLFILNLTRNGGIIGIQVRHMAPGYQGPKYKTYSLSKIYETFLKSGYKIPDEIDTISMIFNILCIDYSRDVIVTEGPMDSFLLPNAIALCGAGKHVSFPFGCKYLFDSDKEGRKHSLEYINSGNRVFLWEKFKRDNGIPDQRKWDINDVLIWAEKNNVKLTKLDDYFSDDTLDIIDI